MWLLIIISGTLLISSLMTGVFRSFQKIYGYSNPTLFGATGVVFDLGKLPLLILQTGVRSIAGMVIVSIALADMSPAARFYLENPMWLASPDFVTIGSAEILSILSGIVIGLILALGHLLLVKKIYRFRQTTRNMTAVAAGMLIGMSFGGLLGGFVGLLSGGFLGGTLGGLLSIIDNPYNTLSSEIAADCLLVGCLAILFGVFFVETTVGSLYFFLIVFVGFLTGWIFGGLIILVRGVILILSRVVFFTTSPFLILLRFQTIICNHCLRFTQPLRSQYEHGSRSCEHCQKAVEYTHDPGIVILIFGHIPLTPEGRVFVLANPDLEQHDQPMDISQVYIDPQTCEKRLLERFITYQVNYPPKDGICSVKILYRGDLRDLGPNLENGLRNTFAYVAKTEEAYMAEHLK